MKEFEIKNGVYGFCERFLGFCAFTEKDEKLECKDELLAETDRFAKRVRAAGITEIMERLHLELSFEMMKDNQYASDRSKGYRLYYIVR